MRRWVALLGFALWGCFGEEKPVESGTETGASNGGCPQGSDGCACYGNGTCDSGLMCVSQADVCVAEGCTPGQLDCACVDGECLGDAVCEAGLCVPPGVGTGTSASTTDASATTSADATSNTTVEPSTTAMSGPTSESDPTVVDTGVITVCAMCVDDAVGAGFGACEADASQCDLEMVCAGWLDCVTSCVHDDLSDACLVGCCPGAPSPTVDALIACLNGACGDDGDGTADFCPLLNCGG